MPRFRVQGLGVYATTKPNFFLSPQGSVLRYTVRTKRLHIYYDYRMMIPAARNHDLNGSWGLLPYIVNPIKLETGLRPNSAGIPYTLLLRIEAMGFPTFRLLL